ncbi:MAG: SDR family NAD(P)-dependent oxidoreductase [Polyangia bacterium]
MNTFEGKVAAITGAGSGMGRTLAMQLAREGCEVAISDIDEVGLAETVKQLHGARVTSQRLDVADREAVFAWADRVVADHGRCNLIFNNAGVALAASAESTTPEDFHWIMNINFWGVVNGTQAFLPHLRRAAEGHVINTSSLFGLVAFPSNSAYNATKFAVRGYTEALRIELDMQHLPIGVTCVHPGGIKTKIARSARVRDSITRELGIPIEEAGSFEKLFKVTAEEAAEIILDGVRRNQSRVLVGNDARTMDVVQRLAPQLYQRLLTYVANKRNAKWLKRATEA